MELMKGDDLCRVLLVKVYGALLRVDSDLLGKADAGVTTKLPTLCFSLVDNHLFYSFQKVLYN